MEKNRFPNKLKFFRRCHGYSQKKVSRMLGHTDTSTLCRWERGVILPNLIQTFRLAKLYCVEPHDLFHQLWEQTDMSENLLVQEEEPLS